MSRPPFAPIEPLMDAASALLATPSCAAVAFFGSAVLLATFWLLLSVAQGALFVSSARRALTLAILVGFAAGMIEAVRHIAANDYWALGLRHLAVLSLAAHTTSDVLTVVSAALLALVAVPAAARLLPVLGFRAPAAEALAAGLVPALLVFAFGGRAINRAWLPDFFTPKSLAGNALWTLACAALAWVLGWTLLLVVHRMPAALIALYDRARPLALAAMLVLTVLGLNAATAAHRRALPSTAPNVILISVDTLRADHLSCYGYDRPTPHIDGLAADGVLFENAIAQSPWTLPSHMSIFTGLYSRGHGVIEPTDALADVHVTLAEVLQNTGYVTAAFTDGGYLSRSFGYQGFDTFDDGGGKRGGQSVEAIVEKALAWLGGIGARPFFLFVHTYQVHCPYDPPPQHDVYSDPSYRGPVVVAGNCAAYYSELSGRLGPADFAHVIAKYDGELRYTDEALGELFAALRASGLYERSVIILTSDHGENFDDHPAYLIGHGELYDEVVKIPLLIKGPGLHAGQRYDAQVESIDIMPTVLELLALATPARMDGQSLLALARGQALDRDHAFSENHWRSFDADWQRWISRGSEMIRSRDWKLVRRAPDHIIAPGLSELFDLRQDPDERANVLPTQAEAAAPLLTRLDRWTQVQAAYGKASAAVKSELDGELTDRLRALGYVN